MPLASGTRLGVYEVLGPIGTGGMGEVYEARDSRLGRLVALKVLPSDMAADPERLERFEREAKAVAALDHPNIVTLYGVEETGGTRYLAMERIRGRTLSELIDPEGLPVARILELGVPIAEALAAAHEKGVIHRDLKPANVMVTDDGRVKILDFGLAKVRAPSPASVETEAGTEPLTQEGVVFGTVPYMAPEQLRGERVDGRADIFSFGAMLYELAAGRRPFQGTSAADLAAAILRAEPPPLEDVRPGIAPAFARVVRRCLEKDPRQRLQSAVDLKHELQDIGGAPGDSSRRWLVPAIVLAIVVVAAGTAAVITLRGRPRAPSPAGAASIRSVAVLPFENLAHDTSQDYFVDGMHDALITDLAKLGTLRVTSRSSVMPYKGKPKSMREVARELGVDALIEGSVLRAGNKVRITAQLIRGETDEHLWAESYDRDLEDVLRLLADVSRAIAGEVRKKVAAGAGPPLPPPAATPTTVRPEAWEAYLRGRNAILQGSYTPSDLAKALPSFEEAVALDPRFAKGWSGVAAVNEALAFFRLAPVAETLPKAREAARKAIALDESTGEAWGALGTIELYFDWNFPSARSLLERAVALDPHSFLIRHALADYLMAVGKTEESLEQVKIGLANEPTSPAAQVVVMFHTETTHRYEEVVSRGRRILAGRPDFAMVRGNLGSALWKLGRYDEALAEYRILMGNNETFQLMESAYRKAGPRAALKVRADAAAARFEPGKGSPLAIAGWYAQAAESGLAFEWLEKSFAERAPQILHIVADPAWDPYRDDPRYNELIRRIGIPLAR